MEAIVLKIFFRDDDHSITFILSVALFFFYWR